MIDCYYQSLDRILNYHSPNRKIGNKLENHQCNQENKKQS